ncbi:MAG: hypothetical protein K1X94_36425, partial [Sandaracinaceae bacterium]|nr:hypothetical protein [Sandaracinaceae bacterium]
LHLASPPALASASDRATATAAAVEGLRDPAAFVRSAGLDLAQALGRVGRGEQGTDEAWADEALRAQVAALAADADPAVAVRARALSAACHGRTR